MISLLSVSPLIELVDTIDDDVDDNDEFVNFINDTDKDAGESSAFTAEVHANHIEDILSSFYGVDVSTWVTNQTADSCGVNIKVAKILGIPHINCENHLLNNEVKQWMNRTTDDDDDASNAWFIVNLDQGQFVT